MDVKICKDYGWFYYIGENIDSLLDYKCGKWMYFFNNADFVAEVCEKAVRSGVVVEAKHMDHHEGVACFYLNIDDYEAHRRVIEFFIENKLIRTTKTGKYYNITFKRDNQTLRGMYNSSNNFSSELKLDKFIDLKSGQWVLNEKDLYGLLPLEVKLLSRTQNCALNKTIYGTDTLHKYISLAFPNTAPIMTSPDNYEVGFWQENNIPNGVFRKKLYIVTFNAVFYLKAGETPFVKCKTSLVYGRRPLETSDILCSDGKYDDHMIDFDGQLKKCFPQLIMFGDDFELFLQRYDIVDLKVTGGCFWS